MQKNTKKGFTLVELLFVMAIISVLGAFAITQFSNSRTAALKAQLMNSAKARIAYLSSFSLSHEFRVKSSILDIQASHTKNSDTTYSWRGMKIFSKQHEVGKIGYVGTYALPGTSISSCVGFYLTSTELPNYFLSGGTCANSTVITESKIAPSYPYVFKY